MCLTNVFDDIEVLHQSVLFRFHQNLAVTVPSMKILPFEHSRATFCIHDRFHLQLPMPECNSECCPTVLQCLHCHVRCCWLTDFYNWRTVNRKVCMHSRERAWASSTAAKCSLSIDHALRAGSARQQDGLHGRRWHQHRPLQIHRRCAWKLVLW